MKAPWLIISSEFVKTGGQDRANFALASYLARQGHEVHLVAHRVEAELRALPNLFIHHAHMPLDSALLGEPFLQRVGTEWAQKLSARHARVICNGGNCDWPDVNWVHYVHAAYERQATGGFFRRTKMRVAHRRFLDNERRALAAAKIILANSHRTKRDLVELLHIPGDRVRVIYYGIDPDDFRPPIANERDTTRAQLGWPNHRFIVLFVGALGDRRKGFDTVFAAWKLLAEPACMADLYVIGQGADLPMWKRRVMEANLSGRIQFLGFRDDVPRLMRAADALVSPTRYEAYGLGVHEALACGLPALVSADAGVAEQYPPQLSELLLPDPNDPVDLAARLRFRIEHKDQLHPSMQIFSAQLRSRTWDDMSADIVDAAQAGSPGTTELLKPSVIA